MFSVCQQSANARTKSHQMKYSTGVQFVADSCASEVAVPATEQDLRQVGISSDNSLPLSRSNNVEFFQKFIYTICVPVF